MATGPVMKNVGLEHYPKPLGHNVFRTIAADTQNGCPGSSGSSHFVCAGAAIYQTQTDMSSGG